MKPALHEPDLLVRDSFIMPVEDHALIAKLVRKFRLELDRDPTKNEILRVALKMADEADKKDVTARLKSLRVLKRGRPKGS